MLLLPKRTWGSLIFFPNLISYNVNNKLAKFEENLSVGSISVGMTFNIIFTITAEIHARSLANFYCQYADRHMNLKFMRRVSEREPAIRQFFIVKTN